MFGRAKARNRLAVKMACKQMAKEETRKNSPRHREKNRVGNQIFIPIKKSKLNVLPNMVKPPLQTI
jgi:hypothetical protein